MSDEYQWEDNDHFRSSKSIISRKKKSVRIYVQRKRLSKGISFRSTSTKSNSIEQLTSIIEKKLNRTKKKKNIIIVNYKPVFVRSREQKPHPLPSSIKEQSLPIPTTADSRRSIPLDIPDVEDPLMFIEMMYQQLFTEDGQLRSGTEPTAFANRVKQIVTQSRRNSIVQRDSLSTTNLYSHKSSSSPRFLPQTYSEDEESPTLLQKNSRRSSKQSSIDYGDHQQQLHAFLNSYRHYKKRRSTNYSIYNTHTPYSIDDTDNEDLDTLSDVNSYRKHIRHSPRGSFDEDTLRTDSKLLCSSGYQSFKSPTTPPIDSNKPIEKKLHSCPNCVQILPSTTSSINLIQPIREILVKYLNFILISKNILFVPLLFFLLRQRPMHIDN